MKTKLELRMGVGLDRMAIDQRIAKVTDLARGDDAKVMGCRVDSATLGVCHLQLHQIRLYSDSHATHLKRIAFGRRIRIVYRKFHAVLLPA